MDDSSSAPLPESKPTTASGASKFLDGLPSSGLFSSTVISSNLGGMRVYITDHDTSPPEDQLIKTDQQNILIRSLVLKQQKGEPSSKGARGTGANEGSRKRPADKAMDGKAKKPNTSMQEGSKSRAPDKNFQSLTVERLRALLKEKGLSLKGKKDELVSRLRDATG